MKSLPTIICTSVIRSTQQGDSHGGVYLVDLETERINQVIDWDDPSINWEGRGADRGLRGIAFYKEQVIFAASDEIFFCDQNLKTIKSFKNTYLRHCHEIDVVDDKLYLSSTGFDSILVFDLKTEEFIKGYVYRTRKAGILWNRITSYLSRVLLKGSFQKAQKITYTYDPREEGGPHLEDTSHINNVFVQKGKIYFSGTALENLVAFDEKTNKLHYIQQVEKGTHNVSLVDGKMIYNNTANDKITSKDLQSGAITNWDIKKYSLEEMLNTNIPKDYARQGFARGICFQDDYIIGGTSPSTITVYSISEKKIVKSINITMDIRNSVHGLEIYPFEFKK